MSNRIPAFLAYLVPVLGPLFVLLARRDDGFAAYHARQSLMLTALTIGASVGWAIGSWLLLWIPTLGPLIAILGFTLVVLVYVFLAAVWVLGMANALRDQQKPLPVLGSWAERIPIG